MKKSILLGISLVLLSCSKNDNDENVSSSSLSRNLQPTTMKYQLVNNMIKNYRTNQLQSIQNSGSNSVSNDAQAIWFDIEALKEFIADVESQTNSNSEGVTNKLGIRFYYAAYPEKSKWGTNGFEDLTDMLNDPSKQLYEKKHTLIMIPTINVGGVDKDFNPMDKNTYNGFNKTIGDNANYEIMSVSNSDLKTIAKNHGTLFPPDHVSGVSF